MKKTCLYLLLIGSMILVMSSCQKAIDKPFTNLEELPLVKKANSENNKKVYVSNLDELYAAVNDPGNTGKEVVLAPGSYVLSASYPNGGRLELQTDMCLKGQPGQRDAVLIDQSSLPLASFVIPAGRTGGIRMGKGKNTLEWLSIKGGAISANPFSVINTDLLSPETKIGLYKVYVDVNGSNLGVNLRNRLAEHAGRKIFAEIENCELTGAVNFNGIALALQNANGSSDALIDLTMKNNYLHGNKIGILAFSTTGALSISNCTIKIKSYGDNIEGNGVGIDPSAGVNQSATTTSNNNTTVIEMFGSSIRNNNPPGTPHLLPVNGALPGGIFAASAYNSVNSFSGYNRASNNTMKLSFYGCDISNNNGTDIHAYGAWGFPAVTLPGSNNLLDIYLHGISANAIVNAVSCEPVEPGGTNVINVYR